ncbi:MAG: class I mannose-6-phosphate isomerase [Clostridiales bacterium]|nr:class I mannose-6-phosphate isomerase [Clostridiales bacterium]
MELIYIMLYPLKFKPIFKEKIWGGDVLKRRYNMKLPSSKIGESWNIASHKNGMSVVSNGPLKGESLEDIIKKYGRKLLGKTDDGKTIDEFPLLIKLLDARDVLSVQVHPDDVYAKEYESGELGKTEMWYIIDADPGSFIVYGVEPNITRDGFRKAIEAGDVESCLRRLDIEPGDVIYMPAGMVHAIGAGILLCEIQQNSDTTYRVYDWDRIGDDGMPRELHIDKALDVIDFEGLYTRDKLNGLTIYEGDSSKTYYIATNHFAVEKLRIQGTLADSTDCHNFHALTAIEGSGCIVYEKGHVEFSGGDSILIPAVLGNYKIEGNTTLIKAYMPNINEDIISPLLKKGFCRHELLKITGIKEETLENIN